MNYEEILDFLYDQLPMFQRVGNVAFKKDLSNITALCEGLGHPQRKFKSIHIAGTNGKGSTAHIIAANLQCAGYKTGLYTSPHYIDYRERIKIDGQFIDKDYICSFVNHHKTLIEEIKPSFFELTVALAFNYFADCAVDFALIETGLGGRLDSTNIITPILSIITNIGFDHEAMLGNSLEEIAAEKAGIIKQDIPVLIGADQRYILPVFEQKASSTDSTLLLCKDILKIEVHPDHGIFEPYFKLSSAQYPLLNFKRLKLDLLGEFQKENLATALSSLAILKDLNILEVDQNSIIEACSNIHQRVKFMGRFQLIRNAPLVLMDSAHNLDGIQQLMRQLSSIQYKTLHLILGTVNDKNIHKLLSALPKQAKFYFCKADIPRGLDTAILSNMASKHGLKGSCHGNVADAYHSALKIAKTDDCVLVCGSIFVVGELLSEISES